MIRQQKNSESLSRSYKPEGVKARTSNDGSIKPVNPPRQLDNGSYVQPQGRKRKGMYWDYVKGKWVPEKKANSQGFLEADCMAGLSMNDANNTKYRNETTNDSGKEEERKVLAIGSPFHIDTTEQKAFYTSVAIEPPIERYAAVPSSLEGGDETNEGETSIPLTWTVAVGDTVAIHYDPSPGIKCVQGRDKLYPYNVKWGIADITAIYRTATTEEGRKLEDGASASISSSNHCDEARHYEMEVRWLYSPHDIPGKKTTKKEACDEEGKGIVEEVFETDHVDEIDAISLLGPVQVHTGAIPKQNLQPTLVGMPTIHRYCQRSWSIRSKKYSSIGSEKNRSQSAMKFSKYLVQNSEKRAQKEQASATVKRCKKNKTDGKRSLDGAEKSCTSPIHCSNKSPSSPLILTTTTGTERHDVCSDDGIRTTGTERHDVCSDDGIRTTGTERHDVCSDDGITTTGTERHDVCSDDGIISKGIFVRVMDSFSWMNPK